jgi:hypothetical protein
MQSEIRASQCFRKQEISSIIASRTVSFTIPVGWIVSVIIFTTRQVGVEKMFSQPFHAMNPNNLGSLA